MSRKLLITGYYGFGNLGDEAILTGLLSLIHKQPTSYEVIVVSGDPQRTKAEHSTEAVDWKDLVGILQVIRQVDLVLIGGGGLYHDYWGVHPEDVLTPWHSGLSFLHTFTLLATLLSKPYMLFAVGVGPLNTDIGREYTRQAFLHALAATVRDQESLALLEDLGVAKDVRLSADPAFAMPFASKSARDRQLKQAGIEKSDPFVSVNLRYWDFGVDPDNWTGQVAGAFDSFLKTYEGRIVFLPFQREEITDFENDWAVCRLVLDKMDLSDRCVLLDQPIGPELSAAVIGRSDLVVAMRLHAVIFAIRSAVPLVALSYDSKVHAHMSQEGLEAFSLPLEAWDETHIKQTMDAALENSTVFARTLEQKGEELHLRAELSAQLLEQLMQEGAVDSDPFDASLILEYARTQRERTLDSREERERLVRSFDALNVEQSGLYRQIEADQGRIQEQQAGLDESHSEQVRQRTQIEGLDVLRRQLQAQIVDREATIENQSQQLSAQEAELQKQSKAIGVLEARRADAEKLLVQHKVEAEQLLATRNHEIERQRADLEDKRKTINELQEQNLDSEARAQTLEDLVEQYGAQAHELAAIKQGVGWIFLRWNWRFRLLLAPQGSRRERLLLGVVRGWYLRSVFRRIKGYVSLKPMTWYAYVMDRYLRDRRSSFKLAGLEHLNIPHSPGLVSVVLPAYNGEDYIREALDSLRAQSYLEWELIAIDDGSIDQTGAILDEYAAKDDRITVLHQENRKIPATLSHGFKIANGEYLTWISCDNRLKPDFLQRMVACLERHPTWDMIYANLDIIGEDGQPLLHSDWYRGYQVPLGSEHIHLPQDPGELNTWPNNYIGAAFLYRRRVAMLIGSYSKWRYTLEDYDYWMRVNALLKLRHVGFDDPLYEYRFHSTSLTHQDDRLGITRYRPRLMVFDDFRRDFYLGPMLWTVATAQNQPQRAASKLVRDIQASGQKLMSADMLADLPEPAHWLPAVYVEFADTSDPARMPPRDLPSSTLRALVLDQSSKRILEFEELNAWDVILELVDDGDRARKKRKPLSIPSVSDPAALFPTIDIRARMQHLSRIEAYGFEPDPSERLITVVLCTYLRGDAIEPTLASLAQQTLDPAQYEVLVVNNDPEDKDIQARLEQLREAYFAGDERRLRWVECTLGGLSHARNAGIGTARGEIICFLDDDALADADWLKVTADAFTHMPDVAVLGGQILLKFPEPRPAWIKDGWEGYWSGLKPEYPGRTRVENWWEFPWGANWSARRKALYEVGGFRTRYGRRGRGFAGGEEIVAAQTIQTLGYSIAFEPASVVTHDIDLARFTRRHVWHTVLSGRRTWYHAQRDLYLPMTISLKSALVKTFRSLGKFSSLGRENSFWFATAGLNADLHELGWTIRDQILMRRRPVTSR